MNGSCYNVQLFKTCQHEQKQTKASQNEPKKW